MTYIEKYGKEHKEVLEMLDTEVKEGNIIAERCQKWLTYGQLQIQKDERNED